jgi:hypothetical protein
MIQKFNKKLIENEMGHGAHLHFMFGLGKVLCLSGFLMFLFVFPGCHNSDQNKNDDSLPAGLVVTIDTEKTGGEGLSKLLDTVLYISLETTDQSYVGSVDKVIFENDRIFILDKTVGMSVFCFDIRGRFLYVIDNRGRGPEEYLEIRDFDVAKSGGKVLLYDGDRDAILVYNSDNGLFEGRYPISFKFDAFFHGGGSNLIAYSNHTRNNPQNVGHKNIFSFNYRKDTFISGILEFDPESTFNSIVPEAFSYTSLIPGGGAIYDLFTSSIYLYDGTEYQRTIKVDFGKKSIPQEFWKQGDAQSFRRGISEGTFSSGFVNFQIFGDWLVGLYSYKNRYHCLIYNTVSHEYSVLRNMIIFSKHHLPLILTPLYHTDGNNLIVAVESHVMKSLMRDAPDGLINFPSHLQEIEPDDNPILQIIVLK